MPYQVAVIGGGSWGTTVAALACHNAPTTLWCRRAGLAEQINTRRCNEDYLPGLPLPEGLMATASFEEAVRSADVLVMGVPSHAMRSMLRGLAPCLRPWVPVVSLAKGLEEGTQLRMTEVISQELPGHPTGVLTGPNLAKEILLGQAAASVVAFSDERIATELQRVLSGDLFRVYTNPDVVGCEIAGALKNVIAIASGMADGLGTGDNTRAAVISRGLAELTRLGVAMGGQPITFFGLAGMGDLIATCSSAQSRNRYVGEQLGLGRGIDEIIDEMKMVAEGVKTSRVVMELAERYDVDMPIASEVYAVIHEGRTAMDAYRGLLRRDPKPEMRGIG
jgi:glycerol-3-phosphate dehydrogenase (NAD(P)+)